MEKETEGPMTKPVEFHIYKAKDGIRWRAQHSNGQIVAESGEAYKRKAGCRTSLRRFISAVANLEYEVVDKTK